jgi:predicted metal-dependent HD superfamily phosphohydrolase
VVGYNELKSIELFKEYAASRTLSDVQIAKVEALITATIHHTLPHPGDSSGISQGDMAFFLDIDMAILASDEDKYDQYAANVRKEYGHYSDSAYRSGRKKVLELFLERDTIYLSHIFEGNGMEEKARRNMKREIEESLLQ